MSYNTSRPSAALSSSAIPIFLIHLFLFLRPLIGNASKIGHHVVERPGPTHIPVAEEAVRWEPQATITQLIQLMTMPWMRDASLVAVSTGLRETELFTLTPERINLSQRNTWASWHVQQGTPLMVLKELGGWETIEMVQKYAHLAPSHIAAHANTVNFWSRLNDQKKTPLIRVA